MLERRESSRGEAVEQAKESACGGSTAAWSNLTEDRLGFNVPDDVDCFKALGAEGGGERSGLGAWRGQSISSSIYTWW